MRINFSEKPCVEKKEKLFKIYIPILIVSLITILNSMVFLYYRTKNSASHQQINKLKEQIENYNKKMTIASSFLRKIPYKKFKKEYSFYYSISAKKMLSWADLFNQFEKALPEDVKLSMISPKVEGRSVLLSISAEAKSKDSELKFIENLEKNKNFAHPFVEYESFDPVTKILKFSISVQYRNKL
ncbi:PilN domain-containing protein [Thermotomaculum hydrothermale]|uniref:PilN domain-containing protein n=1 Tax=Thermotomaculum hydrothermale TaxID=981385 RepID=UPI001914EE19|nr:PilN domain-containing protein [Thermotomaculum hydrothermale]